MSDPLPAAVLANLLASLLSDFIKAIVRHAGAAETTALTLQEGALTSPAFSAALTAAVAAVTSVDRIHADLGGESLREFLEGPEVAHVMQQAFTCDITGVNRAYSNALEAQFVFLLRYRVGLSATTADSHGPRLFKALVAAAARMLDAGVARGDVASHSLQSAGRSRVVMERLSNIERSLDLLRQNKLPAPAVVDEIARRYCEQVAQTDGYVVPQSIEGRQPRPIDLLYVDPVLARTNGEHENPQALLHLLARWVVKGDPGGGKSTLAAKLVTDTARRGASADSPVVPVLVSLKAYGRARETAADLSLIRYCETQASAKYQLEGIPPRTFEYLALNGRLIAVLDGLDELLDTSDRVSIVHAVHAFASQYRTVPMLVTSRKVGYEQAPLDGERFESVRLTGFSDSQVAEYAQRWFALDTGLTGRQRVDVAAQFVKDSSVVPDLRTNPLMLSLLCTIYRGAGDIPRNRPEVFEKCAIMLFERWDRRRGIRVTLSFESRLRPTLQHLAHWIYTDPRRRDGVSQSDLVEECRNYLFPRRFETEEEAEDAALAFIDFCKGRAWVFTDMGSKRGGESLFQFTHQTFLEYFTAEYLLRQTGAQVADLVAQLGPRVERREWDLVSQLAMQMYSNRVEDGADGILPLMLADTGGSDTARENRALFVARCLGFLVPSPRVTRDVTHHVVRLAMHNVVYTAAGRGHQVGNERLALAHQGRAAEMLRALAACGPEIREFVADAALSVVTVQLRGGSDDEAATAVEAAEILAPLASRSMPLGLLGPDSHADLRRLARTRASAAVKGVLAGCVRVQDAVDAFGIDILFRRHGCAIDSGARRPSLASRLLTQLGRDGIMAATGTWAAVGSVLATAPPPWAPAEPDEGQRILPAAAAMSAIDSTSSPEAIFAIAALLAVWSEFVPPEVFRQSVAAVATSNGEVGKRVARLLELRAQPDSENKAVAVVSLIGATGPGRDLLVEWCTRRVSLRKVPAPRISPEDLGLGARGRQRARLVPKERESTKDKKAGDGTSDGKAPTVWGSTDEPKKPARRTTASERDDPGAGETAKAPSGGDVGSGRPVKAAAEDSGAPQSGVQSVEP